jgi:hypothetical protein
MPTHERKTVLELPLKVVLTEEGTTVFIRQNKKLTKFKLADNVEEYGLLLEKFVPASIQRILLIDYISKIEISRAEFVSRRQEVMDLTKLIVYGMLYRQNDTVLFSRMLSTDVIKRWNRANPGSIIDDKTRFSEQFVQGFLRDNEKAISDIRAEILGPLQSVIMKNSNLLPDEMNIQLFLGEKFLLNLRPMTWYILSKFRGAEGYETLLKEVRSCLAEYMEKSRIAEYAALMIIELAVNAENANLRREARSLAKNGADPATVLLDPAVRRRAVEELVRKGELAYLSWKIGGTRSSIGTQGKLQVTLYNRERDYKEIKDNIEAKKSADLKRKTLTDFYREMSAGEADIELGLYYLSYLSEACEKVGVKFESVVSQIKESDTTVIALSFYL